MDRRWIGSWLSGPRSASDLPADESYQGERLGLPQQGSGSVAGFGRRLGALVVDWLACVLIARGVLDADRSSLAGALAVPALFTLEYLLLLPTTGFTLGMRLFGISVSRLDGRLVGPPAALVRTLLLVLAVPALIWDRDGRGLHDKAAGTVVLRR